MWWGAGVHIVHKGCTHYCNCTASDTACACERLRRIRTCLGNTRTYTTPGFWIPAASKRHIPCTSENTTTLGRATHRDSVSLVGWGAWRGVTAEFARSLVSDLWETGLSQQIQLFASKYFFGSTQNTLVTHNIIWNNMQINVSLLTFPLIELMGHYFYCLFVSGQIRTKISFTKCPTNVQAVVAAW